MSQEDTINAMTRTPPRTPVVIAGAVVIGALGWVGGYAAAGLYLAVPFLHERETPELFAGILVVGVLMTLGLAAVATVVVERLGRLTGSDRTRWRWGAALCYLATAAASATILLYQHYHYLEQFGR